MLAAGTACPGTARELPTDPGPTMLACGGVAVYPDDIIHGDSEAVVVIPRHLAAEIAEEGEAMERREEFLLREIESGRSIVGVYPPNEETLERYRQAVARGEAR